MPWFGRDSKVHLPQNTSYIIWKYWFTGKESVCTEGELQGTHILSLGWEDFQGEGNGNPVQYSCLEILMGRESWWATVHGVAKESNITEWLDNNNTWRVYYISADWVKVLYILNEIGIFEKFKWFFIYGENIIWTYGNWIFKKWFCLK